MANYREFYEETRRRKRKAAQRRFVAAIVVLGVVLAAALLLVRCGKKEAPAPAATEKPQAMATPAPLTAQTGREDDGSWNTREPVEQTIDGEIRSADYRMLALPANGTADPSYLNGVTFLGDSLTQGFQTYAGLEAKDRSYFCAYKGMGVKQVVDDATVKNLAGEEQVPMQALIDSQPDNVYVELGVNTLNNTTDESFIAYYDRMLERLTSELPDGVGIYVQALPPIREEKRLPNQMSLTNERPAGGSGGQVGRVLPGHSGGAGGRRGPDAHRVSGQLRLRAYVPRGLPGVGELHSDPHGVQPPQHL